MTTEKNAKKKAAWKRYRAKLAKYAMQSCPMGVNPAIMRGTSASYVRRKYMPVRCNWGCPAFEQCFEQLGLPTSCPMGSKRRGDRKKAACVECRLLGKFKCPWKDKYR